MTSKEMIKILRNNYSNIVLLNGLMDDMKNIKSIDLTKEHTGESNYLSTLSIYNDHLDEIGRLQKEINQIHDFLKSVLTGTSYLYVIEKYFKGKKCYEIADRYGYSLAYIQDNLSKSYKLLADNYEEFMSKGENK